MVISNRCSSQLTLVSLFSVVSHCAFLRRRSYCSPYADCYPTEPRLLCGWSDGLDWSLGCGPSDASGPLCSISLWPKTTLLDQDWAGNAPKGPSIYCVHKNRVFDPSPCAHAYTWTGPPPPCGLPHAVDMKYISLS